MVLGSGIKGLGPRLPLYSANATDLTQWKFLGALVEMPEDYSSTGDASVSGSFRFNFEVPGFFPLREEKATGGDGNTTHSAIHAGTEEAIQICMQVLIGLCLHWVQCIAGLMVPQK